MAGLGSLAALSASTVLLLGAGPETAPPGPPEPNEADCAAAGVVAAAAAAPMLEGGSPGITGVGGRLPLAVLAACRASLTAFTAACSTFAQRLWEVTPPQVCTAAS